MKLACTGFVSATEGSVSAANALMLNQLLDRGFEIDFFSKPSFVDPRPIVGSKPGFRFVAVNNTILNAARERLQRIPLVSVAAGVADTSSYNQLLGRRIAEENRDRSYDLCLWLGDYARGSVPGLPTVSFPQGPPGTDARSILSRYREIRRLAGARQALKWRLLAQLRLSTLGRPPFHHTDHFIIGSRQSANTLVKLYSLDPDRISVLPYPIDLELFKPRTSDFHAGPALSLSNGPAPSLSNGALRVLWLGRIVPRKRLDLFLDGASLAIKKGIDLKLTLIGSSDFIGGYQLMIRSFPYPDRLTYHERTERTQVPALLSRHDVLAQPSEEENFGSSVAEAQACGLPVIVGHTNGNADYLSIRDIHLTDEQPETFANALVEMSRRKNCGELGDPNLSRVVAEKHFDIQKVTDRLAEILQIVKRS
jgi:glycosyltransferase involved in cell wall biosynthesis